MNESHPLELLALRCEREEPSWALTCDIEAALTGGDVMDFRAQGHTLFLRKNGQSDWRPQSYTTSLDAAVTLVPEDDENFLWFWRVGSDGEGDPAEFRAQVLCAGLLTSPSRSGIANTAAMALCAAALRARAAMTTDESQPARLSAARES